MLPSRRSRRNVLVLLAGTAGAALLSGCGGAATIGASSAASSAGSTTTAQSAAPAAATTTARASNTASAAPVGGPAATATPFQKLAAAPGKKGKIAIAEGGSPQELAMRLAQLDAFQKAQQDWTVDFLQITGDRYQWLLTRAAAGETPDVVYMNENYQTSLFAKGLVRPLDTYLSQDKAVDVKTFYPDLLKAATYQGKLYAIPQEISPWVIYYNADLFQKAGVATPKDDWNWDDFLATAQKLTSGDGPSKVFGYNIQFGRMLNWALTNGGDFMNAERTAWTFSAPKTVEAFQWMVDLMWKYRVTPTPTEQADLAKVPAFQTGRVAMSDGSASSIVVFNKEANLHYDVVRIPQKATQRSGASTLTYGISGQSKAPDGAWEAIKFLCANSAGQTFIATATFAIPAVQDAQVVQTFEQANARPANAKAFVEQSKSAELDVYPPSYQDAQTAWNRILADVWTNQKPVQEAMQQIDQQANALLKG